MAFYYLTLFHTASESPTKTTIRVVHFHPPLFKGGNQQWQKHLGGLNTSRHNKCGNAGDIWKLHQHHSCCLKYFHLSISSVWHKKVILPICLIKSNGLLSVRQNQHNSNGSRSNNTIQPSNTSIDYTISIMVIFWYLCVEIHWRHPQAEVTPHLTPWI